MPRSRKSSTNHKHEYKSFGRGFSFTEYIGGNVFSYELLVSKLLFLFCQAAYKM